MMASAERQSRWHRCCECRRPRRAGRPSGPRYAHACPSSVRRSRCELRRALPACFQSSTAASRYGCSSAAALSTSSATQRRDGDRSRRSLRCAAACFASSSLDPAEWNTYSNQLGRSARNLVSAGPTGEPSAALSAVRWTSQRTRALADRLFSLPYAARCRWGPPTHGRARWALVGRDSSPERTPSADADCSGGAVDVQHGAVGDGRDVGHVEHGRNAQLATSLRG